MDNYEMAHGHALAGLAGRAEGLASSPLLCSGHNATLGHRALPHFTIGFFPPKPLSIKGSQYVLVFILAYM